MQFLNKTWIFEFFSVFWCQKCQKCNFSTKTEFLNFSQFFGVKKVKSVILIWKLNFWNLYHLFLCKVQFGYKNWIYFYYPKWYIVEQFFIHLGDFLDQKMRLFEGFPSTVSTKCHPWIQAFLPKKESFHPLSTSPERRKEDNFRGFSPTVELTQPKVAL